MRKGLLLPVLLFGIEASAQSHRLCRERVQGRPDVLNSAAGNIGCSLLAPVRLQ
jgi:hypothetical protein